MKMLFWQILLLCWTAEVLWETLFIIWKIRHNLPGTLGILGKLEFCDTTVCSCSTTPKRRTVFALGVTWVTANHIRVLFLFERFRFIFLYPRFFCLKLSFTFLFFHLFDGPDSEKCNLVAKMHIISTKKSCRKYSF